MDDGTETSFALDDDIGDTHLATKGREVDHELDGIDIVGDNNKRCLLRLDQGDNMVKAVFGVQGLLRVLRVLVPGSSSTSCLETSLLFLLALGAVLVQKLEQLCGSILVEGVLELGDSRGNLETLVEDDLLTLETDVFRPLDEASKIASGLNVLA